MSMILIKAVDFFQHKNIKLSKCKEKSQGILFLRYDSPGLFGYITMNEELTC